MSQDRLKSAALSVVAIRMCTVSPLLLMVSALPALAFHKQYAPVTANISCPGDRKVWVNTRTGVYHLEGERWYGRTKQGQFECEKTAEAEGDRETRNGQ